MKTKKEIQRETEDLVSMMKGKADNELSADEKEEPQDFQGVVFDKALLDTEIIIYAIRYAGERESKDYGLSHEFDITFSYKDNPDRLTMRTNHGYVKIIAKYFLNQKAPLRCKIMLDTNKTPHRYYLTAWTSVKSQ